MWTFPLILGLLLIPLEARAQAPVGASLRADVELLASDALEGRAPLTPGGRAAAAYIAARMREAGLEPGAEGFFQPLPLRRLVAGATAGLRGDGWRIGAAPGVFEPTWFSREGVVRAPLCFVGYGISAPELGYDDYAEVEAEGAIVILLGGRPGGELGERLSASGGRATSETMRLVAALSHKASGVIVVGGEGAAGELPRILNLGEDPDPHSGRPEPRQRLPAAQVARGVVEAWLGGDGALAELEARIARTQRPASRRLGLSLTLDTRLATEVKASANVVGWLPGETAEWVLIGAHYDHLGVAGSGAADGEEDVIYNGADDNASGVAAMLELARRLARGPRLRRGVAFVAFGAEEVGLLGSEAFARHSPWPLEGCAAMLNLDMVGRAGRQAVLLRGSDRSLDLAAVARGLPTRGLRLAYDRPAGERSDHAPFVTRGVPALFITSGEHPDYHSVDDELDGIELPALEALCAWLEDLTREVATSPTRPRRLVGEGRPRLY